MPGTMLGVSWHSARMPAARPQGAVLITGASTGIGEASALRLARAGCHVFAGIRRPEDGAALVQKAPSNLTPVQLDVTDEESVREASQQVEAALGGDGLAGIVNNAGIALGGPLELIPLDALRRQFEVNVFGLMAVTQAFLPLVRRGNTGAPGRIVNMGSISGRFAGPFVGPYAASKHALEALSDSLRVELRPWGIHVALIEPGRIATPIWEKSLAESEALAARVDPALLARYQPALERMRAFVGRLNSRRLPPERVAQAVEHALFAPRPETRYVIGLDAHAQLRLSRFVPDRLRDAIVIRALGLPRER